MYIVKCIKLNLEENWMNQLPILLQHLFRYIYISIYLGTYVQFTWWKYEYIVNYENNKDFRNFH